MTPGTAPTHATLEMKRSAADKIDQLVAQPKNADDFDPFLDAVRKAFAMEPQLIYFLTDRRFDPKLLDTVKDLNKERIKVRINTIAFIAQDDGYFDQLRALAKDSGGTFKYVSAKDAPGTTQPTTAPATHPAATN